jgi:NAD(P)-dependent dehydrogenase (short-subunit alcohol dehydrogenase family)/acyl carrier protein
MHAAAPGELVGARPAALDDAEAATLPIAYGTARYALEYLASLQPGERVLIHAAAGGVGLAAVRLAQHVGAEVFATAGSPTKRDYLHGLGVTHVYDSRSVDFAQQILVDTGGHGVDVVLNSLTGDFIPASLTALTDGGRFLEIGKRGIWEPEQVAALDRAIQYFVVYLGGVCQEQPAVAQTLLRSIVDDIEAGILQPLPVRSFPITDSATAFRFMAQARHIGKIALILESRRSAEASLLRADATYLVTGGLSGLGLRVARDLVRRGGRHLVLVGRGEPSAESRDVVGEMEALGVEVRLLRADVGRREDVAHVLKTIQADMPPLRGLVHAAGVIEDAILQNQTWAAFERVLSPKLDGTWHLHSLTADCSLDFFVLFSAAATLLGSPGQANYAAANAFLDGMAHLRRASGLPALSINWGPWADTGMAAGMSETGKRRLAARGFGSIAPQRGLDMLHDLLGTDATQVAVLPMDWNAFAASLPATPGSLVVDCVNRAGASRPARPMRTQPPSVAPDLLQQIAAAPRGRRRILVLRFVREQAGTVLDLDPSRIDPRRPLNALGLDSLMAVELRNALASTFELELPVTLLFDYPTIDDLTDHLLRALPDDQIVEPELADEPIRSEAIDELDQLSEDEAELLLLAELGPVRKERAK